MLLRRFASVAVAALGLAMLTSHADAHKYHHYRHVYHRHPVYHRHVHRSDGYGVHLRVGPVQLNIGIGPGYRRPIGFVGGALNCARSVNAELRARGVKGTGSAAAASFRHWGHASGPHPGAVAVYGCCGPTGHVAIVSKVVNGKVFVWNPSPRGWREIPQRMRPIGYRAA